MRLSHPGQSTLVALTLVLASSAIATSLPSQQTPPQSPITTLHVASRITVVDVTVTDAAGRPVHNLKQSDFSVKEDGKPQSIASFEEYGSVAPSAVKPEPKLPPNIYTNLQPPPAGSASNILLLDFINTAADLDCVHPPAGQPQLLCLAQALEMQHQMKHQVTTYLQRMPTGTRVAILGMTYPGSLRILQGVTSDPALLTAAVNSLDIDTKVGMPKVDMTLESLNQVAAVAARIPGRKNLLWFTYGLAPMTEQLYCGACAPFHQTFGLLADSQVTVYPVGTRGVYSLFGLPLKVPLGQGMEVNSLEAIAEEGGGVAYHDSNDLATAVAKAIQNGSDYYTLSYVPPGMQYDGKHHTINVKVDRPGLHLTYRNGYYAEDPAKLLPAPGLALASTLPPTTPADAQAAMRIAMSRSMPTSTQLLFDVQVEPSAEPAKPTDPPIWGALDPAFKSKPLTRYGLQYLLPARQIDFTPEPGNLRKAALTFEVAAYDTQGRIVTSLSQTIKLPITEPQYQHLIQGPFRFFQQLDLPADQLYFLRIGILDPTSAKIGTLEIPLTVPKK